MIEFKLNRLIFFLGFLLLQTNSYSQASILFEKTYGGSGNEDRCSGFTNFLKTGYILTGKTNSNDGDVTNAHGINDGLILRVDLLGNIIWCKAFGGHYHEGLVTSIVDEDGNLYSVGYSSGVNMQVSTAYGMKDVWVVKTDSLGNILWEKSYGGSEDEAGYDLILLEDGSIMVACVSESTNGMINDHHGSNNRDVWILKLNPLNGNVIWEKSFGGTNHDGHSISSNNISFRSVSIASQNDSTIIISASTSSIDGDLINTDHLKFDYWLLGIDSDGNINSSHGYGGNGFDTPFKIQSSSDGGFIVVGSSTSIDEDVTGHHGTAINNDAWIVKTNSEGELIWQKCLGGTNDDIAINIIEWDNGYYITGASNSANNDCPANYGNTDILVYYIDTVGNLQWSKNFGSTGYDESYGILRSVNNTLLVAGYVSHANYDISTIHSGFDYWLFEYTNISEVNESLELKNKIHLFPNPSNGKYTLTTDLIDFSIEVVNLIGEVIYSSHSENTTSFQLDLSGKPNGIYFVRIKDKTNSFSQKIILN